MTRGRRPDRALENAEKIAKKRGLVHFYERWPGLLADFSITTREIKAEVKIKRLRRIRLTLHGLEREAAEEIAGLRLNPSSHEISREIWIYSPDFFWRIFRVLDDGLVELARDGTILPHKAPGPLQPAAVPDSRAPVSARGTGSSPSLPDPPGTTVSGHPRIPEEAGSPTVTEHPREGDVPVKSDL